MKKQKHKYLGGALDPGKPGSVSTQAPAPAPEPVSALGTASRPAPTTEPAPVSAAESTSGSRPTPVFVDEDEEIPETSYNKLPFLKKLIDLDILEKYSLIMSGWSKYVPNREFEPRLGLVILVKNEIIDEIETPDGSQNKKIFRRHVTLDLNENEKHYLVLSIGKKRNLLQNYQIEPFTDSTDLENSRAFGKKYALKLQIKLKLVDCQKLLTLFNVHMLGDPDPNYQQKKIQDLYNLIPNEYPKESFIIAGDINNNFKELLSYKLLLSQLPLNEKEKEQIILYYLNLLKINCIYPNRYKDQTEWRPSSFHLYTLDGDNVARIRKKWKLDTEPLKIDDAFLTSQDIQLIELEMFPKNGLGNFADKDEFEKFKAKNIDDKINLLFKPEEEDNKNKIYPTWKNFVEQTGIINTGWNDLFKQLPFQPLPQGGKKTNKRSKMNKRSKKNTLKENKISKKIFKKKN